MINKYSICAIFALFFTVSAHALPLPTAQQISLQLKKEIQRTGGQFDALIQEWTLKYSTALVPSLLSLAQSTQEADSDRYIALMAAAKMGGKNTAPLIAPHLKDNSWMLRTGTIRALTALSAKQEAPKILPLLNDSALVVRSEAVTALAQLNPPGTIAALKAALKDRNNYHKGKPLWIIPQIEKALKTL